MKKNIIFLGALLLGSTAYSQVGINNETPKATLDVSAKTPSTAAEGIIAPRLSGDDIKGKDGQYLSDQKGAIVYATSAVSTPSIKTANITAEGYYYFDGALWVKFGSGTVAPGTEPWNVQGTTTQATGNSQNIYQQGKVAVGFTDADGITTKQLEVKGDFKSEYNNGGLFSGIETNSDGSTGGQPGSNIYMRNAENVADATTTGSVGVYGSGQPYMFSSAKFSDNTISNGQLQSVSFPNLGSAILMNVTNGQANTETKIEVNGMGPTGRVLLSDAVNSSFKSEVSIFRTAGVQFNFNDASNVYEGSYRFPRNAPTLNQVLARVGTATGGTPQLGWADVSTLAPEPWRIQGTTNPATANTDNIYQQGSVAIGIASGASIPAAEVTANNPKLYVAGNVSATGSFYTTTSKYADYVFEDYLDGTSTINENYKFKSLAETAAYIKANKHLPGVTAIKDILKTENGYNVNLSELSIQQLEKIEELYLHTIEQQEEIAKQKTEINDLKSRMEKLEQLLVKENNNK
ncbi:MAG: uncharacterized protein K0R77_3243 [Chryseobacterium sp.]|jgi:hypothetical protein|uniref:hypothetical protein n=1 Tax=Chryseobacterium sp. TaxID=1871047 RepID=UPI0026176AC2|nr:hypothetical protein [Chryseobacterium sp.]MDF2553968.1 uncharacterized protein [Chryseobacterium sp.]